MPDAPGEIPIPVRAPQPIRPSSPANPASSVGIDVVISSQEDDMSYRKREYLLWDGSTSFTASQSKTSTVTLDLVDAISIDIRVLGDAASPKFLTATGFSVAYALESGWATKTVTGTATDTDLQISQDAGTLLGTDTTVARTASVKPLSDALSVGSYPEFFRPKTAAVTLVRDTTVATLKPIVKAIVTYVDRAQDFSGTLR